MKYWLILLLLPGWALASPEHLQHDSLSARDPLKTTIIFNQPKYAAGDTIFFKIIIVHALTLHPLEESSLVNVLLADSSGAHVLKEKVRLTRGESINQMILPEALHPGIYRLVAFHEWMINDPASYDQHFICIAGEREFGTPHAANNKNEYDTRISIHHSDSSLQISTSKKVYAPREDVALKIKTRQRVPGTKYTVTVFNKNYCDWSNGTLEHSPSFHDNMKRDNLSKQDDTVHRYYQQRLRGKIISLQTGTLIPDTAIVSFLFQRNIISFQTYVINGLFELICPEDIFGNEWVVCRVEKKGKEVPDVSVIIQDEKFPLFQAFTFQKKQDTDRYFILSGQRNTIAESYNFYKVENNYEKVATPDASTPLEEEVFGADMRIDLADYQMFPTMEETIKEIIPLVQHRNVKNRHVVRMFLSDRNILAAQDPVYVIDGVVTDDTNYFLSLNPQQISDIRIIYNRDKLKIFGAVARGGMIIVRTKIPGNAANVPESKNGFALQGLSEAVPYKLNIGQSQLRIPDLRTTLYWNPEVKTDGEGVATLTLTTSDLTGDYEILIQQCAPGYEPAYYRNSFKVEFKTSSR